MDFKMTKNLHFIANLYRVDSQISKFCETNRMSVLPMSNYPEVQILRPQFPGTTFHIDLRLSAGSPMFCTGEGTDLKSQIQKKPLGSRSFGGHVGYHSKANSLSFPTSVQLSLSENATMVLGRRRSEICEMRKTLSHGNPTNISNFPLLKWHHPNRID